MKELELRKAKHQAFLDYDEALKKGDFVSYIAALERHQSLAKRLASLGCLQVSLGEVNESHGKNHR